MDSTVWAYALPDASEVKDVIAHVRRRPPPDVGVVPSGWDLQAVASLPLTDTTKRFVARAARRFGSAPLPAPLTANTLLASGFSYGAVADLLAVFESAGYPSTCLPTPTSHALGTAGIPTVQDMVSTGAATSAKGAIRGGLSRIKTWIDNSIPAMDADLYRSLVTRSTNTTVASVAASYGVGGGTVRRCEARVERLLRGKMDGPEGGPVRYLIYVLRQHLGVSAPGLDTDTFGDGVETSVALRLAGPYAPDRFGWLVLEWALPEPDLRAAISGGDASGRGQRIDPELSFQDLSTWGLKPSLHAAWLALRFDTFAGNHYVRKVRATDRAVAALEALGEASSLDTISSWVRDHGGDTDSLPRGLRSSSLIRRVARSRWSLSEWGLPEFVSALDALLTIVRSAPGGSISLADLNKKALAQHGIPSTTLKGYVSGSPVFRYRDGIVSEQDPTREPPIGRHVYQGVYLLEPGSIALGSVIDANIRRGSGRAIGAAAGWHLGLRPGGAPRWYVTEDTVGRVRVGWNERHPLSATRGSLARLTTGYDDTDGNWWITVVLRADGRAIVQIRDLDALDPGWEAVSALTGIPYAPVGDADMDMWRRLSTAVREPWPTAVANRLLARRDDVVASMLPPYAGPAVGTTNGKGG